MYLYSYNILCLNLRVHCGKIRYEVNHKGHEGLRRVGKGEFHP